MKKIIIDVFGGDRPEEVIKGAVLALENLDDFGVIFTGKSEFIERELSALNYDKQKVEVINANEIITNDDSPTLSIRQKKDSSLVAALSNLKLRDDIVGMISCGNTGALLTGGLYFIGRIPGIERPALAPLLPTKIEGKEILLIDVGANTDCKALYLTQFALMGHSYKKYVCGLDKPKVALLSNGTEDGKGNELTKEAYILLKEMKGINFTGNLEARDVFSGDCDVLVSDGFDGNVALKSIEGTAALISGMLKDTINKKFRYKLGYLFMRGVFKELKNKMDYHAIGGAPLLGLEKIVVKAHGGANVKAISVAVLQVKTMYENKLIEKIKEGINY